MNMTRGLAIAEGLNGRTGNSI